MENKPNQPHSKSDNDFENIVDISPFPIMIHKMGLVLYANSICLDLFDMESIDELVGKNLIEFVLPEDRPVVIDAIKKGIAEKQDNAVLANRMLTKKGRVLDIQTKSSSINFRGEDCRLAVAYDYHLLTKVEEELKNKNLLIEKIAQIIPDSLIVVESKTRNVLFENKPLLEMLGYTQDDLKSGDQFDFISSVIHKGDIPKLLEARKFIFDPRNSGKYSTTEYRIKDKQGRWRWILARSTIFKSNVDGSQQINFGISQDITQLKEIELQLVESKNFIEKINQTLPLHVAIFDLQQMTFVYRNYDIATTLGYEEDEIANIMQLAHPDYVEDALKNLQSFALLKEGEIKSVIGKYLSKEGRVKYLITRATPFLMNADGTVQQVLTTTADLTELKETEQELIQSKLFIEKITQTLPNHIALFNLQTFVTEYANYPFWQNLNYTEDPGSVMDFFHPDYKETAVKVFQALTKLKEGEVYTSFAKYITRDGVTKYMLSRATPFEYDSSGVLKLILATTTDMSDLKETEIKLQLSEETQKAILSALPDIVFQVDTDGVIRDMYAGEVYRHFLDDMKMIGRNANEFLPPADVSKLQTLIHNAIEKNTMQTHDYIHLEKGNSLHYELRISRLNDTNGIIVVRDVTQLSTTRKQLDQKLGELWSKNQELEKYITSNAELEKFAYIASHDLREPIRSIVGFTQLLQKRFDHKMDAEAKEFLDNIINSAQRMNTLVLGLLDYSRVSASGKPFAQTDLNEVLVKVLNDLNTVIEENEAQIIVGKLPVINCDDLQIRQLFQNLISNGIKFRKQNVPPAIKIWAEEKDGRLVFKVEDNGIGLDMSYKEKVFHIFSRLHTSDKYPGSGIGLAVCKKIVERHGGEIWLESEVGKGTTFYFTLG